MNLQLYKTLPTTPKIHSALSERDCKKTLNEIVVFREKDKTTTTTKKQRLRPRTFSSFEINKNMKIKTNPTLSLSLLHQSNEWKGASGSNNKLTAPFSEFILVLWCSFVLWLLVGVSHCWISSCSYYRKRVD